MSEIYSGAALVTKERMAQNCLNYSAQAWFLVTAIGQWLFVVYILAHYGGHFIERGVSGFDGVRAFRSDAPVNNLALVFHFLVAGLIIAAGQIQLLPSVRKKLPRLHRAGGWFYMIAVVLVSIAGIYMAWSKEQTTGSMIHDIGTTSAGILVLVFVPVALYHAIKRNITAHRQWALRLFMVVSAVWFLRLMVFGWFAVTGGIGIDTSTFTGPFLTIVHFAQFLLPLMVLELYFWAQKTQSNYFKAIVALLVFLMVIAMVVGIIAVVGLDWLPKVLS